VSRNYLGEDVWTALRDTPLSIIDRPYEAPIRDALGRAMSLYRDRQVMLRAVDNLWVRHLTDLDGLREGIGLRAYGQQDPLVSYKKEAHDMYQGLLEAIRHDIVAAVLRVGLRVQQPRPAREVRTNQPESQAAARPARQKPVGKVGRNDPCPCGSGKKYKYCHGAGVVGAASPASMSKMTLNKRK
jgi:preprotein translocase subunit SecA